MAEVKKYFDEQKAMLQQLHKLLNIDPRDVEDDVKALFERIEPVGLDGLTRSSHEGPEERDSGIGNERKGSIASIKGEI